MKIKIAGKEYEAGSPEALAAQAALEARAQRADAAETALAADRSRRMRADVARAGVTVRADAEDGAIMLEVVKKIAPDVDLSGASPEMIEGAFRVAISIALKAMGKDAAAPKPGAPAAAPGAEGASAARADAVDAGRQPQNRDDAEPSETAEDIRQRQIDTQRRQAFAGLV